MVCQIVNSGKEIEQGKRRGDNGSRFMIYNGWPGNCPEKEHLNKNI